MAIASSGAVSFSDLRTEYVGGSSAISYSDLYRGGSNVRAKANDNNATNLAASVPTSGVINLADFHGTAKGFKYTYSSDASNQNFSTVFGDDFDLNYPKIVDINSGVSIYGSGTDAITIPSGLAGGLTLNNAGTIAGFGGASGGGAGGNCINNASSGVVINNTANIYAGGGGGANGAQGGSGSVTSTSYSGTRGQHDWTCYSAGCFVHYAGGYRCHCSGYCMMPTSQTSCSYGGTTLRKGNHFTTVFGWDHFQLGVDSVSSTTGGAGGAGGVGQGYNQSATTGAQGASGGTNAGAGSAGTDGASYGQAAANSANGGNGNASNGATGNTGGAAGAAVVGTSVTMNNSGTVHGAVA